MSSFWHGVSVRETGKRLALLVSLFLLPCSLRAGPFADLDARLQGRASREAVAELRRLAGDDPDAQAALRSGPEAARAYVRLRASLEGAPNTDLPPIPVSGGDERIASSWLARALDRVRMPELNLPRGAGPSVGGLGSWVTTLMWVLLAGLGILAVVLLARNVRFSGKRRTRKAIAPDEPLRSADAWLEEANDLIGQSRFRESVRGLYVAGLMRLDEAGVARFDRHETNWEHLRRIEASPRRPSGIEARAATELFDRCWYGHLPSTKADAAGMRDWYDRLVAALAGAKQ